MNENLKSVDLYVYSYTDMTVSRTDFLVIFYSIRIYSLEGSVTWL